MIQWRTAQRDHRRRKRRRSRGSRHGDENDDVEVGGGKEKKQAPLGAVSGDCSWSGEGPGDASEEEVVDTADDVEVACR